MRSARYACFFCLFLLPFPIWAQQSAPTSAQGAVLLQRAFGVLAGNTSLADVTLTGTARRIAGSDDVRTLPPRLAKASTSEYRLRSTGEVVRVDQDWFVRRDGTFVPVACSSAPGR